MSTSTRARVLIVDDSAVMRRHLTGIIAANPDLEVIGAASNGRLALQRIEADMPDAVTLDVEMPEMDGLTTLRAVRTRWPRLPVIMCSSLTERGGAATLDALSAGANDYVTKPSSTTTADAVTATAMFAADLVQKLRALTSRGRPGLSPAARPATGAGAPNARAAVARAAVGSRPPGVRRSRRIDVVALGCSTGGPNALAEVLPHIPADLSVPIVIVQHMPALFTKLLAERLSKICAIPVEEAAAHTVLRPGAAYIAPGDYHLELLRSGARVETMLHKGPQENSCRPSVDVMFRSVVTAYGANVLGVILTGMGQDGLRGCELIAANGGHIITQDQATSVVWGMPGFVAEAGLADDVLPLSGIAAAIAHQVRNAGRG